MQQPTQLIKLNSDEIENILIEYKFTKKRAKENKLLYKGYPYDEPVECKLIGIEKPKELLWLVIEVNGELNSIKPEYLQSMQLNSFSRMSWMKDIPQE